MKLDDVIPMTDMDVELEGIVSTTKHIIYLHHQSSMSMWVDVISKVKSSHHIPKAFGD